MQAANFYAPSPTQVPPLQIAIAVKCLSWARSHRSAVFVYLFGLLQQGVPRDTASETGVRHAAAVRVDEFYTPVATSDHVNRIGMGLEQVVSDTAMSGECDEGSGICGEDGSSNTERVSTTITISLASAPTSFGDDSHRGRG